MADNDNYKDTGEGFERVDDHQVERSRVDWGRLAQIKKWEEAIRREREERNNKYREDKKRKDS